MFRTFTQYRTYMETLNFLGTPALKENERFLAFYKQKKRRISSPVFKSQEVLFLIQY